MTDEDRVSQLFGLPGELPGEIEAAPREVRDRWEELRQHSPAVGMAEDLLNTRRLAPDGGDLRNDPRFPDRPQHDHFWALSEAVRTNDAYVEQGAKTIREVMEMAGIDAESLIYMANQRAARMIRSLTDPEDARDLVANMAAVWIDAFLAGLKIGDARSEPRTDIVLATEDGQHRGQS